jgi:signal transduction histidine kinase
MNERRQSWLPDAAAGVGVLCFGIAEAWAAQADTETRVLMLGLAVAVAVTASLSRQMPSVALALVWAIGAWQLVSETQMMFVELALISVAFGTARWGTVPTVIAGGASIPAGTGITLFALTNFDYGARALIRVRPKLFEAFYSIGDTWLAGVTVVAIAFLGLPWVAGLALRFAARARDSRARQVAAEEQAAQAVRAGDQAREIAGLREEQARLARDVHDAVGHSLAVILAQAESAQYLGDDPDRLRTTMANIATSARSSLQDVRQVLSPGRHPPQSPRAIEALIAGVRSSGHEVVLRELGTPQPLPPDLEVVVYRVVQEMLTNAVKHGDRDEPVFVELHWPDGAFAGELLIEVRNAVPLPAAQGSQTAPIAVAGSVAGLGLDGMRQRLSAAGGRLDARLREGLDGQGTTFSVSAWVPVTSRQEVR